MKDSLKTQIERVVDETIAEFRALSSPPKIIILAVSKDKSKLNPFSRGYRDPTEFLAHAHNCFLTNQFRADNHIPVEIIPRYIRNGQENYEAHVIYLMDRLED